MTRSRVIGALLTVMVVAIAVFIAKNTEWYDLQVPTPPKGEAITNPFYAAQRFVEQLGGQTRRERAVVLPPTSGVVVLSAWHWDLSARRQSTLEQWVEAGGRLVVDDRLSGTNGAFEQWTGVDYDFAADAAEKYYENYEANASRPRCPKVAEVVPDPNESYGMCDLDFSFLTTQRPMQWALRNDQGLQAVRVAVGLGTVTVINSFPYTHQRLFEGDHARLFVAATQLRRGDEVVFLSEDDHPSLLALLWRHGGPAVSLSLLIIAMMLWRGAVRFGPTAAPPDPARRSMAEQIRGTGRYVLQHSDGGPLHAAAVRAVTEAARRRIPAYERLSRKQRAAALGKFTGMDGTALTSAMEDLSKRRRNELHNTLGLLELARRQLLTTMKDKQA